MKVRVHSKLEQSFSSCRILLDCGSQRSYITESMAKTLNLPIVETINLCIFTFGSKSPNQIESPVVDFEIITRTGITRRIHANVVSYITEGINPPIRNELTLTQNLASENKMVMADDGSCGDRIDILLGNYYYHSFMSDDKITFNQNLFLVTSDFGWVWSGKVSESVHNSDALSVLTYFQLNSSLDNSFYEPDLPLKTDVKKLWDLESIGITDSPKSTRDEEAIQHFNETTKYVNNRYYVQWPWVEFPPNLHDNLGLSWGRLNSLLKRLNQSQIEKYDQVIQEQLKDGIIEIVDNASASRMHPVHYLPHHCIYRRDKPDKIRIAYDASARINQGSRSLNECLYLLLFGPQLLEDLTGLVIKF